MKCPFCGKNLIEGYLVCQSCRSLVIDFDYMENLEKMEKKYSKSSLADLSKEKLIFEEIITIYTFIERANHQYGDDELSRKCEKDGTFSNLSRQLKEMKNKK